MHTQRACDAGRSILQDLPDGPVRMWGLGGGGRFARGAATGGGCGAAFGSTVGLYALLRVPM